MASPCHRGIEFVNDSFSINLGENLNSWPAFLFLAKANVWNNAVIHVNDFTGTVIIHSSVIWAAENCSSQCFWKVRYLSTEPRHWHAIGTLLVSLADLERTAKKWDGPLPDLAVRWYGYKYSYELAQHFRKMMLLDHDECRSTEDHSPHKQTPCTFKTIERFQMKVLKWTWVGISCNAFRIAISPLCGWRDSLGKISNWPPGERR